MSGTSMTRVWRPSSARRLVLDGFAPVARGAVVAAPLPLSWPGKDPGDVLDYEFDISAALIGNEGDSLASASVTSSPAGPGDLVVNSLSGDGAVLVLWLAGGVAGTTYTLRLTVTTATGRVLERAVLLPVLALADPAPAPDALTTTSGAVVSDQNGDPILVGG